MKLTLRTSLTCFMLVSGAGTAARAQSCAVHGPDAVMGDINTPANFLPVGDIDAAALGMTTCNVGDVWIDCFYATTRHPAVSENLFRLSSDGGFTPVPLVSA